ncbi:MAG TPA: GxxExxY protein [Acidobacteriota bacterium]|nr:GxxExxY protein [Acidobacteriota bacterium]
MDREEAPRHIVDSAVAIHTALGPGLLESVYRRCLMYELGRSHASRMESSA